MGYLTEDSGGAIEKLNVIDIIEVLGVSLALQDALEESSGSLVSKLTTQVDNAPNPIKLANILPHLQRRVL